MNNKIRTVITLASSCLLIGKLQADPSPTIHPTGENRGTIAGPVGQGLYSKPVWRKMGQGTYVGGYADFNYRSQQGAKQKFEAIRMVPFIYGDIAPGLRYATEIEFEHGGATDENTGDAKLEFAFMDYDLLGETLGARGGLILVPLGKFNSMHDSPLNDLNDRPMISQTILPSAFYEPGAGFFGAAYPVGPVKLDYQFYLTQGFNGSATGLSRITSTTGLKSARSNVNSSGDNNENISYTGRLGLSPILGTELGASFHTGTWDNAGQNALSILALDWGLQWRCLEFLGEYANAQIDRNAATDSSVPGRMEGYYGQLNVHFLENWARPNSVFTGVFRLDQQDLDLLNQTSNQSANNKQRLTFGLNFRPLEQTVFKLDYQLNYENYYLPGESNNAIVAGFATYF